MKYSKYSSEFLELKYVRTANRFMARNSDKSSFKKPTVSVTYDRYCASQSFDRAFTIKWQADRALARAATLWRRLPKDLPPCGTIYRWFASWRDDGCFEQINHALVMADRERVGRAASPTAAIIDSLSAPTA
jgi:hypothetical protein